MTLETKKTIALIGSALAAIIAVSGNILMAMQIKIQGSGFYVGYLFYSLAILAGGMFITWLPNIHNYNWGFKKVDGQLKWCKDTRLIDPKRNRLIWLPLMTLFFELYAMFDYCYSLWDKPTYEILKYVFFILTLLFLLACATNISIENARETKKNNNRV